MKRLKTWPSNQGGQETTLNRMGEMTVGLGWHWAYKESHLCHCVASVNVFLWMQNIQTISNMA